MGDCTKESAAPLDRATDGVCNENTAEATPGEMFNVQGRHFDLWSTLGINYSAIGTPLSIGSYLTFNSGLGGSPGYIYGYILAIVMQTLVCVCLAELAAVYPHSSGQMHWTWVLAPPKSARILSYWNGSFMMCAWAFWTCGTYLFSAQLLFATVSMAYAGFAAQNYQIYLVYLAVAASAILLNTWLFQFYSTLLRLMVVILNVGALIVFCALLARATPKRSSQTVFVDFVNESGWDSAGFAFLLGLLPGITATNGFDSATHITDELPNPSKQVPQVMVGTAVLASLAGLPMTIVYMFCVTNEENLLNPVGGQPIAQLFLDSCRSLPLAIFLMVIFILIFYIASAALMTTASRAVWSLASRGHLAWSPWMAKIDHQHFVPANAIWAVSIVACLLGLLTLGPSTALSAILSTAAVCFYLSYIMPLVCLLRDRSVVSGGRSYWRLGRFGLVLNSIAVAWMVLMSAILLFPTTLPVKASNMNYGIVVLAGVYIVFQLNWIFYARRHYEHRGEVGADQCE